VLLSSSSAGATRLNVASAGRSGWLTVARLVPTPCPHPASRLRVAASLAPMLTNPCRGSSTATRTCRRRGHRLSCWTSLSHPSQSSSSTLVAPATAILCTASDLHPVVIPATPAAQTTSTCPPWRSLISTSLFGLPSPSVHSHHLSPGPSLNHLPHHPRQSKRTHSPTRPGVSPLYKSS